MDDLPGLLCSDQAQKALKNRRCAAPVQRKDNFVLDLVSNAVFLIFCIFLITNGVDLLYKIGFVQHQESPAMHLPMIIPYTSWWFCSILMVFRLIQDSIARIKERKEAVAAQRLAKGKEA